MTLFVLATTCLVAEPTIQPVTREIEQRFKLKGDGFYRKYVDAGGIPVISSGKVTDRALLEARFLILSVLKGRQDILNAMKAKNLRVGVMAYTEFTTDMPETRHMSPWWNRRARGLGGNPTTCGEENLLNFKGDPYTGENILIHEFAHAIHHSGMNMLDKTFNSRLKALYEKTKKSGLVAGYCMSSHGEFWAEGVQSWFDSNWPNINMTMKDGTKKSIRTREELIEHMPELAGLLREAFGDNEWRYSKIEKRMLLPHLKDFDPSKAPSFTWPKRVDEAIRIEKEKKKERRKK
ncbi:MAG: hypothetical protein QGF00_09960 [Planctomycetota bacterium]|nr:hypothetical protein [Planctomycetota bacterium]MDP7249914.1 hypothetical protein [Planctomycetota bacterium]